MSQPTVVVTGAAGFIGARFVESCNRRRIPVVSVDDPEFFASRPEHRGLDFGDVVAPADIAGWLGSAVPPRGIVHLGACTDTTELDVDYLNRVNLEASQVLWNYGAAHDVPLVYASSAATYGGGELGYDDDPAKFGELRPLNPYGDSKLQFDVWALERHAAGDHPPAWSGFKFFNVYGFGERHKGRMASVVLQAFDQIRASGSVKLFRSHRDGIADGEQKRDFIHVDDVVDVLWFALEKPIESGVFNLGTGRARTFLDLVRAVFAALDVPEDVVFIDTPEDIRERYQYFTEATMDRLRAQGYSKPFTSLEDGVRAYVGRLLEAAQS
ncbi:MAG: ADP-glyceromanno-heptose 6-epimerase [Planctomycetes bacterium]|nr:ADP-glyceromanno-heptose 6-epimerase [Planctomycetota bacterium]